MKITLSLFVQIALAVVTLGTATTWAQNQADAVKSGAVKDLPKDISQGEVRKVDKDAGKLTIKHGDLKNLNMPAMTMVFGVKDKATLDGLNVGDKIKFVALSHDGKMIASEVKPDN